MSDERKILSRSGDWIFDEEVSEIFDAHVRKSIPCYQEIQEIIGAISREILPNKAVIYDLGTASCEVIKSIHRANPDKQLTYIGVDNSRWMLKKAVEKCKHITSVQFHHADVTTFSFAPADLIVAAFTLQFIAIEPRRSLLKKIRQSLKQNGHFILCEKIGFSCSRQDQLIRNIHENWKSKFFSEAEILAKKNSLKNVMYPLTFSENVEALEQAGFRSILPFFQWGNFICILAR